MTNMATSDFFTLEAIFKVEVVIATILTLGLLTIAVFKKENLKSEETRIKLGKKIRTLWVVIFLLVIPILLFITWEITDFLTVGASMEKVVAIKSFIKMMRVVSFFIFNLGLLGAYYLILKTGRS
jgi:hypothetical protein